MDIGPGDIVRVYDSVSEIRAGDQFMKYPFNQNIEIDFFVVDGPNKDGYYHAWKLGSEETYPAIKWDKSCIKEINPCS